MSSTFKLFSLIAAPDGPPGPPATPVQRGQGACVAPQCLRSIVQPPLIYCGEGERYPHRILVPIHTRLLSKGGGGDGVAFVGFSLRRSFQEKKKKQVLGAFMVACRASQTGCFDVFYSTRSSCLLLFHTCTQHRDASAQRNNPPPILSPSRRSSITHGSPEAALKNTVYCLHSVYMHVCV